GAAVVGGAQVRAPLHDLAGHPDRVVGVDTAVPFAAAWAVNGAAAKCRASPGNPWVTPARTAVLGCCLAAARRAPRRAPRDPAGSHHGLPPLSLRPSDGSRHGLVAAAAVSMAWRSLASSASISPIATRSSGLMNPGLSRKPPARGFAAGAGDAPW